MSRVSPEAILFDLDGTLLDTAKDIGNAFNHVLQNNGHAPHPLENIRKYAGKGSRELLKVGLKIDETHPDFKHYLDQFLNFYAQHIVDTTQFFEGIESLLEALDARQHPWGIVTNRVSRFTQVILEHFGLSQRAQCVISGDTLARCKPDPEPLRYACQKLQCNPSRTFYLGDTEIDVRASKAAGLSSGIVLYGYIDETEDPYQWQADHYIRHPLELLQICGLS